MVTEPLCFKGLALTTAQSEFVSNFGTQPVDVVISQLCLACDAGERPDAVEDLVIDQEVLLCILGLDGDEPDGLSLAERFLGDKGSLLSLLRFSGALGRFLMLDSQVQHLTEIVTSGDLDDIGEEILTNLVAVLERQLLRENEICPVAEEYLQRLRAANPEYLSEEVIRHLDGSANAFARFVDDIGAGDVTEGSVATLEEGDLYVLGIEDLDDLLGSRDTAEAAIMKIMGTEFSNLKKSLRAVLFCPRGGMLTLLGCICGDNETFVAGGLLSCISLLSCVSAVKNCSDLFESFRIWRRIKKK